MTKQLLKPDLAQFEKIELLPKVLLKQTKDANAAIKFMVEMSGATHEAIGADINKPRETITRFLNGNGGLTANQICNLINASGNAYFIQYLANKFGFDLVKIDDKELKIRELEDALEEARRAA